MSAGKGPSPPHTWMASGSEEIPVVRWPEIPLHWTRTDSLQDERYDTDDGGSMFEDSSWGLPVARHAACSDKSSGECPCCHPSAITHSRTIEDITHTVRQCSAPDPPTATKTDDAGDGSYWAPHDEEALRLDEIA